MPSSLRDIPVDTSAFRDLRFISSTKRLDQAGAPRLGPNERPTWTVNLAVVVEVTGRLSSESLDVTVQADADGREPGSGIQLYAPVSIRGLRARLWAMESRAGLSFTADQVLPLASNSGIQSKRD